MGTQRLDSLVDDFNFLAKHNIQGPDDLKQYSHDLMNLMDNLGEELEATENNLLFTKKVSQALKDCKSDHASISSEAKEILKTLGIPETVNRAVIDQKLVELEVDHQRLSNQYETAKADFKELMTFMSHREEENTTSQPAELSESKRGVVWEQFKTIVGRLWNGFTWLLSFLIRFILRMIMLIFSTPILVFNFFLFWIGGTVISFILLHVYQAIARNEFFNSLGDLSLTVGFWLSAVLILIQIVTVLLGDPTDIL